MPTLDSLVSDPADTMPASRLDARRLRIDYAEACQLIRSVRASLDHPTGGGWRHWYASAGDIAGDFFCAVEHPEQGGFAMLGDAAGHGLASAIFALHIPMLFREMVLTGLPLTEIHRRLNRFLIAQQISDYYVCGILMRVRGRTVEVINAAMPDALLVRDDGRVLHAFSSTHLPFGVVADVPDEPSQSCILDEDGSGGLLACTDGLTEMQLPDGRYFGQAGVMASAYAGTTGLFDRLVEQVEQHRETLHDDASIAWVPIPSGRHGDGD